MLARDALKLAVKANVVPTLRAAGFKGTYPTWRLEHDGDTAVVSIQSGQYNEGTYGSFYVSLSVVPPCWWVWTHECAQETPWGSSSKPGRALPWDGLYRGLLIPPGKRNHDSTEWTVDSLAQARAASAEMTAALQDVGIRTMLGLMGPGRMLTALRSGAIDATSPVLDRPGMRDVVLAVLLTDVGGPELDKVCRRLDQWAGREFSELPLTTASWARRRAASIKA
ncbi:DUF4304 domain-containing protein [Knoellia sp. CPCC 206453]|uniref:DUF4304 domain-containing protein n=1 Tax=Knoellia pratensis TaxID=3404796 RepID=UPI00360EA52C